MSDIRLKVETLGGNRHDIEVRPDILVADFIRELVEQLRLPTLDAEGHAVFWRLDHVSTGRTLSGAISFEQQGVAEGQTLSLISGVTAGCFIESTPVLLPGGTSAEIGSLCSGDAILAFHADEGSYKPAKIIGIYRQTYSSSVIINDTVEASPDQHFLLSGDRWVLASDLKPGDSLVSFPFDSKAVTSVARRDELQTLISLMLPPSHSLVANGLIARDLIGKQEHIPRKIDIFLSHSVSDKDQAEKLFEVLDGGGRTVFLFDRAITPGDRWEDSILESLKTCDEFWLLVTPSSLRSEWVTTEWAAAWALRKKIVPVLFRVKPEDLPERLRAYQCVDFHEVGERWGGIAVKPRK